ncbi:MAG: nucleoside deaminase [Candidatus Scalinduaceae bacterium]
MSRHNVPERETLTNREQHQDHKYFMKRAILMAKRAREFPFGAVIVRRQTGEIVSEGFNRSRNSPTFHAEIDAINRCAKTHPVINWKELDLYTTAEPCAMCQSAIEWSGISNVYYGSSIPFLKNNGWWQIDIRAEEVARRTPFRKTRVVGAILEEECNLLYKKLTVAKSINKRVGQMGQLFLLSSRLYNI